MAKKLKKSWWKILVIGGVVVISLPFLLLEYSRFSSRKAEKILASIPQPPQTTFFSKSQTTWPDDTPSIGYYLKTSDAPENIADFYLEKMPQEGWQNTWKFIDGDPGTPLVLNFEKGSRKISVIIGGITSPDLIRVRLER